MRRNPLRAVKIIAIGDGFATAFDKTSVDSEKFRIGAGLPALNARTVCAFLGGVNAAAEFKVGESPPVRFLKPSAAVEKLCRRKRRTGAH
ncbi:hypothetical protein G6M12_24980 [Agrobacterium tumefaciens]|nr:hypothetical protein [Agrobacterium tumefaciens]